MTKPDDCSPDELAEAARALKLPELTELRGIRLARANPDAMLERFLAERYPGGFSKREAVRAEVHRICTAFVALGLADDNFIPDLCSGNEARFWQRFTEAVQAVELVRAEVTWRP